MQNDSNQTFLTTDDLTYLTGVIGEAERTTSGELKLVIVRRSSRPAAVLPLTWLLLTTLGLLALWVAREQLIEVPVFALPTVLILSAVVAAGLAQLSVVQRLMTPRAERRAAAQIRAELEFHREGLAKTKDGTGILLFLSLLEHEAVVLADQGIASRVPAATWDQVLALILDGAGSGRPRDKLAESIRLCGQLLTAQFPIAPDDVDEVSNAVVLKD